MPEPQNYRNHTKIIPLYHGVVFITLLTNLGWSVWRVIEAPWMDTVMGLFLAIALIIMALYARLFAVTVQDRVIRLEMQLRMKEILPVEMQPRIKDFTHGQLVALRFAGDAELPDLAAKVLKDNIQDKKAIKERIKDWQPDHLRA